MFEHVHKRGRRRIGFQPCAGIGEDVPVRLCVIRQNREKLPCLQRGVSHKVRQCADAFSRNQKIAQDQRIPDTHPGSDNNISHLPGLTVPKRPLPVMLGQQEPQRHMIAQGVWRRWMTNLVEIPGRRKKGAVSHR